MKGLARFALRVLFFAGVQAFAAVPPAAAAEPVRIAISAGEFSLDPHHPTHRAGWLLDNVYETLIRRDPTGELVPGLAMRWGRPHPHILRISLESDRRFHDGSPLTLDSVIHSLARARKSGLLGSAVIGIYRARGDTLDIVTDRPDPLLPDRLAEVAVIPERSAAMKIDDLRFSRPIGSGPLRVTAILPGERIELKSAAGHTDAPVQFVLRILPSAESRLESLSIGEVDIAHDLHPSALQHLLERPDLGAQQVSDLRAIFLGFNHAGADQPNRGGERGEADGNPLRDRRVREAIYRAIDIDRIRQHALFGAAEPAGLPIARSVRGFAPDLDERLPHDPEGSRSLLAEAGLPDGFALMLDCPLGAYVRDEQVCRETARMLAEIGIRTSITFLQPDRYFEKLRTGIAPGSLFLMGWSPQFFDAEDFLRNLLVPSNSAGTGFWNVGGYQNPEITSIYERVMTEPAPKAREALLIEALALQKQDIAYIPLYRQTRIWASGPRIEAMRPPGQGRMPLSDIRLGKQ